MGRENKTAKLAYKPKLDALLFGDYASVEYRVAGFYLNSIGYPEWAENFKRGIDPHRNTASKLLDRPIDDLTDVERQFGKTFNFASLYGAGPKKIATMLKDKKLDLPEGKTAKQVWLEFYVNNPGLKALSNPQPRWPDPNWVPGALERELAGKGYVKTLWGRELRPPFAYRVLNWLVQGCSADLMRSAMVKVAEFQKPYKSHLVMTVHDELILDCVKEEIPIFAEALPRLMSDDRIANTVPVEVELEISYTTWAEKEAYIAN